MTIFDWIKTVYFWDANIENLDEDKDAYYIIRRVFELGDIDEIGWVHGWYGTEKCRAALVSAEYLREAAIIQGMVFLGIKNRNLFRSNSKKQYHAI
ncbi:MAG: hypothetical protein AAF849_02855 [Bacteroidota bacterium]